MRSLCFVPFEQPSSASMSRHQPPPSLPLLIPSLSIPDVDHRSSVDAPSPLVDDDADGEAVCLDAGDETSPGSVDASYAAPSSAGSSDPSSCSCDSGTPLNSSLSYADDPPPSSLIHAASSTSVALSRSESTCSASPFNVQPRSGVDAAVDAADRDRRLVWLRRIRAEADARYAEANVEPPPEVLKAQIIELRTKREEAYRLHRERVNAKYEKENHSMDDQIGLGRQAKAEVKRESRASTAGRRGGDYAPSACWSAAREGRSIFNESIHNASTL